MKTIMTELVERILVLEAEIATHKEENRALQALVDGGYNQGYGDGYAKGVRRCSTQYEN